MRCSKQLGQCLILLRVIIKKSSRWSAKNFFVNILCQG
jgi:hypothetical protein